MTVSRSRGPWRAGGHVDGACSSPATRPAPGSVEGSTRRGHVGGRAARSSTWTHAKLLVGHGVAGLLVVTDAAGRREFQTESRPRPRIAGGRSSTRVIPSTSASAAVGVRLVTA